MDANLVYDGLLNVTSNLLVCFKDMVSAMFGTAHSHGPRSGSMLICTSDNDTAV